MATPIQKQKKIVRLYQNERLSAKQIAEKLGVSEALVNYYLKKHDVQKRSIANAIRNLNITKYKKKEFRLKGTLSQNDEMLKLAGVMLYWGEGAKSHGSVKFSNSDPYMVGVFLKFLRNICGIDHKRLKALVHMYPDHNEKKVHEFWADSTGIPRENFYRPCVHVGKKGTYGQKSQHGTITVSYSDTKLLQTLLSWIELYKVNL